MPISGTTGFVKIDDVAKPASDWEADLQQAVIDRSNFTTEGEPYNAPGQRTGTVTISGPYEGTLGVERGTLIVAGLGILPELFLLVTIRVSRVRFGNDKDNGPKFTIEGAQYGAVLVGGVGSIIGM